MPESTQPLAFGAHESPILGTEIDHDVLANLSVDGVEVPDEFSLATDYPHLTQNHIGICTAISLADTLRSVYGIEFSPQFIYVLGKVLFDGNRIEGSSIQTMLRVVNKYGACPASLVSSDDTTKSYEAYINYWPTQAQFDAAKAYKINYGIVKDITPLGFAKALSTSKYGLLTRMAVGSEWYTKPNGQGSYNASDIDPLRAPNPPTGGHAIRCKAYKGLDNQQRRTLRNTWGDKTNPIMPGRSVWARNGDIDYVYSVLKPFVTEAWSISKLVEGIPAKYLFNRDLQLGSDNQDVLHLQVWLNTHGFAVAASGAGSPGKETSYFGDRTRNAVVRLQKANGITPAIGYFGAITRSFVNAQD